MSNLLDLDMQFFAEDTGANDAEPAAPQGTEANTQAEGAGESTPAEGNSAAAGQENGQQTEPQHQQQTPEQNAQFAAARREAENRLAAYQKKVEHDRELVRKYGKDNDCLSDADVESKFGAQGFHTLDDLASEVERQNAISRGEPDPVALKKAAEEALKNNPVIKAFQEAQSRSAAEKTIADFKADFPDVKFDPAKGLDQFDNSEAMGGYLQKGLTLSEAYSLANRKAIQSQSAAAATQAAINSINSKGHINPTGDGADAINVTVPAETARMYRTWFPKMTDKEMKEKYAQSLKD